MRRGSSFKIDFLRFFENAFQKNSCRLTILKSSVISRQYFPFSLHNCFFQKKLVPILFNQQLSLEPYSGKLVKPLVAKRNRRQFLSYRSLSNTQKIKLSAASLSPFEYIEELYSFGYSSRNIKRWRQECYLTTCRPLTMFIFHF